MIEGEVMPVLFQVVATGLLLGITIVLYLAWKWRRYSKGICSPPPVEIEAEESWIPFVVSGLEFVKDPTAFLRQLCERFGADQPFLIHVFGFRMVFVFSAHGLREFYRLREGDASFAEATRTLLGLKLPPETIADGDMNQVRDLMRPSLMQVYARTASDCCMRSLVEPMMASADQTTRRIRFDVFAVMKRTIHELG